MARGLAAPSPDPNNPTPVLGPSIRPRFDGSEGLTHYRNVMIIILFIHNNAYSYLLVLYS